MTYREFRFQFKDNHAALERRIDELLAKREEVGSIHNVVREYLIHFLQFEGAALEELESAMSACQKTEAVAKGAASRSTENVRAAKQRIKSLQSQRIEAEEQLAAKHQAAERAAGVEFRAVQAEAEEAKAKLEAAQRRLQVTGQ